MKLRRAVLPVLLASGTIVGLAASPAAAQDTSRHSMWLQGSMDIRDDEPWPVNQRWCRNQTFSATDNVQYPTDTYASVSTNKKCDGEIRVDVAFTGELRSDGNLCVMGEVRLYEGVTDNPRDRKLRATKRLNNGSGGRFCIGTNGWATWNGSVEASAGDRANYNITIRNTR